MTDTTGGLSGAAAKGAATTLVGQWLKFMVQLAALAILARILDPADYGLITMVLSLTGIALIVSDFGLSMASIQSQSITQAQKSNLFWINALIGLACSSAVFLLSGWIAAFYGQPELDAVSRALCVVFLIEAVAAQFKAEATRKLRFKWMASADIISQVLGLALAIYVGLAGGGYWALVYQQVAVSAVSALVVFAGARWWPGLPRHDKGMRPLFNFGMSTLGVQAVNYLSTNVDSVVLGRFSGAGSLGVYSRAIQLFRLPLQQIAAPMTRVALPVLSRITDPDLYDSYIRRAQLILSYTLCGAFIIAAAISSPLIDIVLGDQWSEAAPIFCVLAIGGVFQALGYVYYWIFLSKNQTALQLKYALISRSAMVALIVCAAWSGPIIVAVAVSAGLVLNWFLLTVFAIPKVGIHTRRLVFETMRPLGLFVGAFVLTYPTSELLLASLNPWARLGISLGLMAVYFTLVYLLARTVRLDVATIIRTVKKIR